jgi:hypothetical protein
LVGLDELPKQNETAKTTPIAHRHRLFPQKN